MIGAAIGQAVNEPGIAVEGEDDWLVSGEEGIEIFVAEAVGVLGVRLELHEIDDVDDANFEIGEGFAEDRDGGEGFERGDVAGAGHDDIGLGAAVVAGPFPDADAFGAVADGRLPWSAIGGRGVFRQSTTFT